MALSLIATAGAADANAYCTLVEAETYHASRPVVAAWAAATDDEKNRAIVTATALLDQHVDWYGYAATTTQALGWPRGGVCDLNGNPLAATVVPTLLKQATAELAGTLLAGDRLADDDVETKQIRSIKAGPVFLSFGAGVTAKVIADAVYFMVRQWGTLRSRTAAVSTTVRT